MIPVTRAMGFIAALVLTVSVAGCVTNDTRSTSGSATPSAAAPECAGLAFEATQYASLAILVDTLEELDGITAHCSGQGWQEASSYEYSFVIDSTNDSSIYDALTQTTKLFSDTMFESKPVEISLNAASRGSVHIFSNPPRGITGLQITDDQLQDQLDRWKAAQDVLQQPVDLLIAGSAYSGGFSMPIFSMNSIPSAEQVQQLSDLDAAQPAPGDWYLPGLHIRYTGLDPEYVSLASALTTTLPVSDLHAEPWQGITLDAQDYSTAVIVRLADNTDDEFTSSPSWPKVQEALVLAIESGLVTDFGVYLNDGPVSADNEGECERAVPCPTGDSQGTYGYIHIGECDPDSLWAENDGDQALLRAFTDIPGGQIGATACRG